MSLIGTGSQRPVSWGNYFWLSSGHRVVNFWAENLNALGFDKVECETFESNGCMYAVITDSRIPEDYFYKSLCFTGGAMPSDIVIAEMMMVMPYKDEEKLLRYTDYATYCKKNNIEVITTESGYKIERRTYNVK